MNEGPPRVSIGMPVFNGDAYLREAVESVLAQTYGDFELIIADNASKDGTEAIGRSFAERDSRVRYLGSDENRGAAWNFNRAFEVARGEYFKWLAHDDVLAPTYLQRCVSALDEAGQDVVLCFPRRRLITPEGEPVAPAVAPAYIRATADPDVSYDRIGFARLVRICWSGAPIFVFGLARADALRRTRLMGNYYAADVTLVGELRLLGEFRQVPEELYFQRLHPPTPAVLERITRRGDSIWFDPANRNRRITPEMTILAEYANSIRRMDRGLAWRWARYCALAGHVGTRLWRNLRRSVLALPRALWRAWSSLSVTAARVSGVTTWPLRLWALAAGARRGEVRTIGLAFARPWWTDNTLLLTFAARRVARRSDPSARRLLVDWLTGASEVRRAAAATAMAEDRTRFERTIRDCAAVAPNEPILRSIRDTLAAIGRTEAIEVMDAVLATVERASGSGA